MLDKAIWLILRVGALLLVPLCARTGPLLPESSYRLSFLYQVFGEITLKFELGGGGTEMA